MVNVICRKSKFILMVDTQGIMILKTAYEVLKQEQNEGESISEVILRIGKELEAYRDEAKSGSSEVKQHGKGHFPTRRWYTRPCE